MRPLWYFAAVSLSCVALFSCTPARPTLSPEEVLRRATEAGRNFSAADFSLTLTTKGFADGDFSLDVRGQLRNGGEQVAATVSGSLLRKYVPLSVVADFRRVSATEQYVRFAHLSSLTPEAASEFLNHWWRLPATHSGNTMTEISPDPALTRMQSSVVKVERDDGVISQDGLEMYHYVVTLDREKLAAFLAATQGEGAQAPEWLSQGKVNGELWIDAQDFLLRRAHWSLSPMQGEGPTGTLDVVINPVVTAEVPVVPADAPPLPPLLFGPLAPPLTQPL